MLLWLTAIGALAHRQGGGSSRGSSAGGGCGGGDGSEGGGGGGGNGGYLTEADVLGLFHPSAPKFVRRRSMLTIEGRIHQVTMMRTFAEGVRIMKYIATSHKTTTINNLNDELFFFILRNPTIQTLLLFLTLPPTCLPFF
jgi:hypothetical protein